MTPAVPTFLFSIVNALFRRRPRAGERGQVIVLSALVLPMLLGITGIGIDYGVGVAVRRNTQNAADAAALAGAVPRRDESTDYPAG